jgi:hypothetical protein
MAYFNPMLDFWILDLLVVNSKDSCIIYCIQYTLGVHIYERMVRKRYLVYS